MKKILRRKKLPAEVTIVVRRDKRFTRQFVRQIIVSRDKIFESTFNYRGRWFILYPADKKSPDCKLSIFLNEHREYFSLCEGCQSPDGVKSISGYYCATCREKAGCCRLCRRNRLDCCC